MNWMSRLLSLSFCGGIVSLATLFAGPLQAGPIPVTPTPVPSAGQSFMQSTSLLFPGNGINIDWEVIPTAGTAFANILPNGYAYLYQIENTTNAVVDILSITLAANTINSVVAAGTLINDSLDVASAYHPAHNVGSFPLLATETELVPFQNAFPNSSANIDLVNNNISWTVPATGALAAQTQSNTLYYLSKRPPVYGNAVAQDSHPPSPWITLATARTPLAQPIPVPDPNTVPEPSSVVLLGIGGTVALVGFVRRSRKK